MTNTVKNFSNMFRCQAIEISNTDGYFIPHHAVIRPEATSTQIRIVFNASFGKDRSLNNLLWKGSVIGLNLLPHLIRLRLFKYLLVADLQKAFLQIHIREDHRRYLRLVWIERDGIAKQYEMTVLPFGVIASPAILTQVVNRIVQDIGNVQSRKLLENAAYMDDLIIGANDKEHLNQCLVDAQRAFESSGFK